MDESSPARLYCLLVGGALVIAGIIGFFYEASFAVGDEVVSDNVFGILAVNGWHNVVHIAIGVLYIVLAILGFVATGDNGIGFVAENGVLIDLVPVNNDDNWLHVILGVTGILAGLASGRNVARVAPQT